MLPDKIGRFDVELKLGQGAMGVVYLATDPVLGRRLAVKCIQVHPGLSDKEVAELRQRFENEARAAANLSHPNLVTVFDAGVDDHTLYIAMEYVQGEALDDILAADRLLTYKEVADLALQLGSALDHAHGQGIVHRDIKPANILINRSGQPKITDFGVARQAASTLTATGTIIGTPAYMSPEQITGHAITGAADQFSLAIVLYELLTGRAPFFGEGATTVLYKIVHEQPEPPNAIQQALPGEIDAVVLRALSKDPAARFGSCSEFAEALRGALGAAPADLEVTLRSQSGAGSSTSSTGSTEQGTRRVDRAEPDVVRVVPLPPAPPPSRSARGAPPAIPLSDARAVSPARASLPSPPILWGGVAVAAIVIVALAFWGLGGSGDTRPGAMEDSGVGEAGGEAAPLLPPAATAPAAPPEVALRIVTRPEGASVSIDGTLQPSTTPLEVSLPQGERHQLLIERAGYESVAWAFSSEDLTPEQAESGQLFFPLAALVAEELAAEEEGTGVVISDLPPVDPVQVRGDVEAPVIVEQARPPFPQWAAEQGLATYVILELVIDREGRLREARVLNNVHPTLGEQAVAAVWSWTFEPALQNGHPVDVLYNVTVQFHRDEDDEA